VVNEAVDHNGGHDVVAEDFAPAAERFVRGDDQAGAFVAGGDELEEEVGRFGLERAPLCVKRRWNVIGRDAFDPRAFVGRAWWRSVV
jgi:hypothetical protein